ncbi:hypothetical protein GGF44_001830 [Coemansia sp. RSA 1694]|nr:hypothetical protein GGF38_001225 [Coemansia sp. RSA 25]KAJ2583571.1 hypothetical protein GGH95_000922 [Coemansia sp. RSA 1836]KAJ2642082.1 hypothetical protein GGF44_001830 [Coemansia sp. RSA 1694]
MNDNSNNKNSDEGSSGCQTEQNFEALLQSANQDRTPEDFERAMRVMEKKREALTAKWTARLKGKTLIDAEPAPIFARNDKVEEKEEEEAEAESSSSNRIEAEVDATIDYNNDIPQNNVASTTGADIDGNSIVGSTGDDADEGKVEESVADKSSIVESEEDDESDFDGGSDDRFFSLASLPANRRILYGANAPMTMDYRPDRLNVVLDDNGVCIDVFFV